MDLFSRKAVVDRREAVAEFDGAMEMEGREEVPP